MDIQAKVTHQPDAFRLDAWPLLVHAPDQHGDFVATEDRGIPAYDLAAAVAGGETPEEVARRLGTTAEHVHQAVTFAADQPPDVLKPRLTRLAAARADAAARAKGGGGGRPPGR